MESEAQIRQQSKTTKSVIDREQRKEKQRAITYIVIGTGNRGTVYGLYAFENPSLAKVVGIAEPRKYRAETFLKRHNIPSENVFSDWRDVLKREKFADAVVIATPDSLHTEPAIAFAKKGYHILVEKPLAITAEDCGLIAKTAQENGVILAVGHVMRYTPYTQQIKEIVDSGRIGKVITVQHVEPVGYWHFAHSYVRGNWRKESEATFSLMAKSCHDIDWIRYIIGAPCLRVSSFGSLSHFVNENKPKEAGDSKRCLDCPINNTCPYSATQIYLESYKKGNSAWPVNVIVNSEPSIESVTEALREGPYGRCAYEADNDVCDNQVVNMEFAGGRTASFSMIAFSEDLCVRKTRIYGTHGQLDCDGVSINLTDFRSGMSKETITPPSLTGSLMTGHHGGDWYLMDSFVAAVAFNDPNLILSGPKETLESHLLVFAAEKSRHSHSVENTSEITKKYLG